MADAFHMVSDLIGLIVGLFSLQMAKKEKTNRYSYGWIRAEPIGGLVNGVFLISMSFYILIEAVQRFVTPPGNSIAHLESLKISIILIFFDYPEIPQTNFFCKEIEDPKLILIVGAGGLLINLIGLVIFSCKCSLLRAIFLIYL